MLRIAGRLAVRQPLIGYGRGAGARAAGRRELSVMGDPHSDVAPGEFHNVYVMHVMEWGVLGLAAYLGIHVLFLRSALALRRRCILERAPPYHFAGLFVGVSVIYMTQGFLGDITDFLYLTSLFYFLAGLVYAQLDVTGPRASDVAERHAAG